MRVATVCIAFVVTASLNAVQAADKIAPESATVRALLPDLNMLARSNPLFDLNAIPKNRIGFGYGKAKAHGTPEIDAKKIPDGYVLLPLEFFIDRGDASAVQSGDRVVCKCTEADASLITCINDATVFSRSVPVAKTGSGLYASPTPEHPATHRVFGLLLTKDEEKRFWRNYDLNRASSGLQLFSLHRHPKSTHE